MAQNDVLKRYIDAAMEFRDLTQTRAEALVKDLVKAGEVQADQARDAVTELLERSRKNSEKLVETIRTEVKHQITSLGLASQADIDRMEHRLSSLLGAATAPAKKAAAPRPLPPRRRWRRRPRRRRRRPPRRPRRRRRPSPRRRRPRSPPRRPEPLARRRLDAELVRRGLAPSRQQAQADIAAGRVHRRRSPGGQGGAPRRAR